MQLARLRIIPADVAYWIRKALVFRFVKGRLARDQHATRTHIIRLNKPEQFLAVLRLLKFLQPVDLIAHGIFIFLILYTRELDNVEVRHILFMLSIIFGSYLLFWYGIRLSGPASIILGALSLYYRAMCIFVLMYSDKLTQGNITENTVLLIIGIIMIYFFTWGPVGLVCAQRRWMTSIVLIPFIPFALFLFLWEQGRNQISVLIRVGLYDYLIKNKKVRALIFALTIGGIGGYTITFIPKHLFLYIMWAWASSSVIFVLPIIAGLFLYYFRWLLLRRWIRVALVGVNAADVVDIYRELEFGFLQLRILQYVRASGLLSDGENVEEFVSTIMEGEPLKSDVNIQIGRWTVPILFRTFLFPTYYQEKRDELYKLREDMLNERSA